MASRLDDFLATALWGAPWYDPDRADPTKREWLAAEDPEQQRILRAFESAREPSTAQAVAEGIHDNLPELALTAAALLPGGVLAGRFAAPYLAAGGRMAAPYLAAGGRMVGRTAARAAAKVAAAIGRRRAAREAATRMFKKGARVLRGGLRAKDAAAAGAGASSMLGSVAKMIPWWAWAGLGFWTFPRGYREYGDIVRGLQGKPPLAEEWAEKARVAQHTRELEAAKEDHKAAKELQDDMIKFQRRQYKREKKEKMLEMAINYASQRHAQRAQMAMELMNRYAEAKAGEAMTLAQLLAM